MFGFSALNSIRCTSWLGMCRRCISSIRAIRENHRYRALFLRNSRPGTFRTMAAYSDQLGLRPLGLLRDQVRSRVLKNGDYRGIGLPHSSWPVLRSQAENRRRNTRRCLFLMGKGAQNPRSKAYAQMLQAGSGFGINRGESFRSSRCAEYPSWPSA